MQTSSPRRSLVFQILKLLLALIIAVALLKIAFFPSQEIPVEAQPGGQYATPTIEAKQADITNTLRLNATVVADPPTKAKSEIAGKVEQFYINDGDKITKGQAIALIRSESMSPTSGAIDQVAAQSTAVSWGRGASPQPLAATPLATPSPTKTPPRPPSEPRPPAKTSPPPAADPNPGGGSNREESPARPVVVSKEILSPADGTAQLSVVKGQVISAGEVVASVSPGTLRVSAALSPEQLYRLDKMPASAQVAIKNGPAPFDCPALKAADSGSTQLGGQTNTPNPEGRSEESMGGSEKENQDSGTSNMAATCAVPNDVKVFAGLKAQMTISAGQAKDAVVVPVSAIEGRVGKGFAYVVKPEQQAEVAKSANPAKLAQRREVKLGISDGKEIQISSGLKNGETVLLFAPGASEEDAENSGGPGSPGSSGGRGG